MKLQTNFKRMVKRSIRPFWQQWLTQARFTRGLGDLEIRDGGTLLVHSSLSTLGFVPGGVDGVIAALRKAIGERGTLVLPTHTWEWVDAGERTFDVRLTPCCVGKIPEMFRTMPSVRRSLHPTHSVAAIGPNADNVIENHECSKTPCGVGTPYDHILSSGQILFLGTGLESNTAFHTIESISEAPYLLRSGADEFEIVDEEGVSQVVKVLRHARGPRRRFAEFEEEFIEQGIMSTGFVGSARSLLIDGPAFRSYMLEQAKRDVFFTLTDDARRQWDAESPADQLTSAAPSMTESI